MTDLVEFLRARLDEDEQVARYSGEPGRWDIGECVSTDEPGRTEWEVVTEDGNITARTATNMRAAHIARHDPARALREVERDREIVELHGIVHRNIGWMDDGDDEYGEIPVCGLCVPRHSHFRCREDVPKGPCLTLRLLALPHVDHPDYRGEWKP